MVCEVRGDPGTYVSCRNYEDTTFCKHIHFKLATYVCQYCRYPKTVIVSTALAPEVSGLDPGQAAVCFWLYILTRILPLCDK